MTKKAEKQLGDSDGGTASEQATTPSAPQVPVDFILITKYPAANEQAAEQATKLAQGLKAVGWEIQHVDQGTFNDDGKTKARCLWIYKQPEQPEPVPA